MKKVVFILIALQFALYSCKKQDEEQKSQNHCIYDKWKLHRISYGGWCGSGSDDSQPGIVDYDEFLWLGDDFRFKKITDTDTTEGAFSIINDSLFFDYYNTVDKYIYNIDDEGELVLRVIPPYNLNDNTPVAYWYKRY